MPRPAKTLKFVLTEDGRSVRAVLAVDGVRMLRFENKEVPRVNVRHPRTNEKELLEMAEYWSHRDPAFKKSPAAALDHYIDSRFGDIAKHVLEIRKALRKITGSMRNANVAKNAKEALRK